jgi:hypothetical protein
MPKKNAYPGDVGSSVVLLLHSLQYEAEVLEESEDGTIKVLALAVNNGHEFTRTGVKQAPVNTPPAKLDPLMPFWTTREELDAMAAAAAPAPAVATDPTA